jgi:hypothetical protein
MYIEGMKKITGMGNIQRKIAHLSMLEDRAKRQQAALDKTRESWEKLAHEVMGTPEFDEKADRLGFARTYDFGDVLA